MENKAYKTKTMSKSADIVLFYIIPLNSVQRFDNKF